MTEKQQHELRCETCNRENCPFGTEALYCVRIIPNIIRQVGCASHTSAIPLTPSLTKHYAERSQATGKPVQALVLQDLAALHRKRVAREEKRVFRENEYERL